MDIVNHGSALPVSYMNLTGVSYPTAWPGQLTPFGMRQMYMRGREMRRRYITNTTYLSKIADPNEIFAYAIDTDRTYQSALAFMTGLYPGDSEGPLLLTQNQTAIAVPPVVVEHFSLINSTLNMQALVSNF